MTRSLTFLVTISLLIYSNSILGQYPGCTDPNALNYSPLAESDNGLCCYSTENYFEINASHPCDLFIYNDNGTYIDVYYPFVTGFCIPDSCFSIYLDQIFGSSTIDLQISRYGGPLVFDYSGEEYWGSIDVDAGGTPGCTDPTACNYHPWASCADYSLCNYECYGCMDPEAANFDPNATMDHGNCCDSTRMAYIISDLPKIIFYSTSDYYLGSLNPIELEPFIPYPICLQDDCHFFQIHDINYGFNVPANISIIGFDNDTLANLTVENFTNEIVIGTGGLTAGCIVPNACNYNPEADCYDFSCNYDCYGCMDPEADNYNPEATIETGQCCYHSFTLTTTLPIQWNEDYYDSLEEVYTYLTDNGDYSICIDTGCRTFNLLVYSHTEPGTITVTNAEGEIVDQIFLSSNSSPIIVQISLYTDNLIWGCTNPNYCNYDPLANCGDFTFCNEYCFGCTDPTAANYDPEAIFNDGSCCYADFYRIETADGVSFHAITADFNISSTLGVYPMDQGFCMPESCFELRFNQAFDETIPYLVMNPQGDTIASGIGTFNSSGSFSLLFSGENIIGCTNPNACNYDPAATCMFGSYGLCEYDCYGCIDPAALNYNAEATMDDNSCCYEEWYTVAFNMDHNWMYQSSEGNGVSGFYPFQNGFCFDGSCSALLTCNYDGTPLEFTVMNASGDIVTSGVSTEIGWVFIPLISEAGDIGGCTDPTACNFDPNATCEAGWCEYTCFGCTDPLAYNFDPTAQYEDYSCQYNLALPLFEVNTVVIPSEFSYSIALNMTFLGNDPPYTLSNSLNDEILFISSMGTFNLGPFECGESVVITITSQENESYTIEIQDPFNGDCTPPGISSTQETFTEQLFKVFPVPARDEVYITGPFDENDRIQVLDLTGRVILEKSRTHSSATRLSLETFESGYFIVKIYNKERYYTVPFLITK